ncbi:MAG: hypothetical protein WCJ41_08805 [Aestuariivirga sp.]|uniref:hypothetical protein n=1 Tax=Aestuariivirga sp. TaxID=2650926 RepID=UPI00301A3B17
MTLALRAQSEIKAKLPSASDCIIYNQMNVTELRSTDQTGRHHMDGTQATLQAPREPTKRAIRPAPTVDNKELRRVLRSVKKVARGDGSALKQPIAPGGPSRYDHYQAILLDAFKDQLAGSIRRLKASKPIAVKTRKVVAAMLALNKYAPDDVITG